MSNRLGRKTGESASDTRGCPSSPKPRPLQVTPPSRLHHVPTGGRSSHMTQLEKLSAPEEHQQPPGSTLTPVGLCIFSAPVLGGARRSPAPFAAARFPSTQLRPLPPPPAPSIVSSPALETNAKVGLNGRLLSHQLSAEPHIKVVLQSRNKFQAFFSPRYFPHINAPILKREGGKQTEKVPASLRLQGRTVNLT